MRRARARAEGRRDRISAWGPTAASRCRRSIRVAERRARTRRPSSSTRDYRLVAWDVGAQHVTLGSLVVSTAGATGAIAHSGARRRRDERAARRIHRSACPSRARDRRCSRRPCSGRGSSAAARCSRSSSGCCGGGCVAVAPRRTSATGALARREARVRAHRGARAASRRASADGTSRCTSTCCATISRRASPRPRCRSRPPSCSRRCAPMRRVPLAAARARARRGRSHQVRAPSRERRARARARGARRAPSSTPTEAGGAAAARIRGHARARGVMTLIELPSIEFASPWVLLLLLLLPLWWLWRRRSAPPAIVFSRVDVLAAGAAAARSRAACSFILRNLLLARADRRARAAALGRARGGRRRAKASTSCIAIDLSSSMLAQDFQPQNRLEVAKDKVKQFILGAHSDRIGVVAFAGEALTQVPLTTDYPVVNAAVDNLQAGQLEDGTAIGTAIATAANRLRSAPGRSRVMILLTDGENNRGSIDPRTAAKAAAAFGIKIYTIGVGTKGWRRCRWDAGCSGCATRIGSCEIDEALLSDIADDDGRPVLPRARCGGAAAHLPADRSARAGAGARAHVRALHGAVSLAARCRAARDRARGAARGVARTAAMIDPVHRCAVGALRRAGARALRRAARAARRTGDARRRLRRLATTELLARLVPPTSPRARRGCARSCSSAPCSASASPSRARAGAPSRRSCVAAASTWCSRSTRRSRCWRRTSARAGSSV